jgi:hypothetical protein
VGNSAIDRQLGNSFEIWVVVLESHKRSLS